jgi:hypothetical protein
MNNIILHHFSVGCKPFCQYYSGYRNHRLKVKKAPQVSRNLRDFFNSISEEDSLSVVDQRQVEKTLGRTQNGEGA